MVYKRDMGFKDWGYITLFI